MFHSKKKQKLLKQIFSDQMHNLQDQLVAATHIADPLEKLAALHDLKETVKAAQVKMSKAIYGTYDKAGNAVAAGTVLTMGSGLFMCLIEPISGLILLGSGLGGGMGTALSMRHFISGRLEKPYNEYIDQLLELPKTIQAQHDALIAAKSMQIMTSEKFLGVYADRTDLREDLTKVFFAAAGSKKMEGIKQFADLCESHPEMHEHLMHVFLKRHAKAEKAPAVKTASAPQGFQLD